MTTAVQLISKLGSIGVKLWLDDDGQLRFKAPKGAITPELKNDLITLKAEIIDFLQEAKGHTLNDRIPLLERDLNQEYTLSFAQQRFWFLDRLEPGNPSLHIPAILHISGSLDIDCLRQSLTLLAERHESLRTGFITDNNNTAKQFIWPSTTWELLENFDLSYLDANEQPIHIQHIAEEEALRPFEIHNANNQQYKTPLLRTRLARLTEIDAKTPEYILFITMHHIIADGWSVGILINELKLIYHALKQGNIPILPTLDIHYIDFAQWQRNWMQSTRMEKQLAYWKQQLKNVPILDLPTDFIRPKQTTHHGANHTFTINTEVTKQLREITLSNNSSIFITLFAAYHVLLSRYSNQKDICVGTPIAGRTRQDTENIIGCFINLLAIRSYINPNQTFQDYLHNMQQTILTAQENQDIPFELIAEECTENRSLAYTPIFQVLFTYQQINLQQQLQVDSLDIKLLPQQSLTAKYDIQLHINETESILEGNIEFNTDLFTHETIEDISRHYCNLLATICRNTNQQTGKLSFFDEQDLQLLAPTIQTDQARKEYSLLTLLNKYHNSENIAIRCGDSSITHKALHQKANALAYILLEKSIDANDRVGICMNPGIDFMIALLGTIKCGASYVPMDTNYPVERLTHMINNAEMAAVIALSSMPSDFLSGSLSGSLSGNQLLLLDELNLEDNCVAPDIATTPDQLLYLIYTSGSTGLPKGAGVSHYNEVNLLRWYIKQYAMSEKDRILVISSIGFDLTQKNLLASLVCGAEIIFSPISNYDPQVIIDTIVNEQVTWINCAPSAFYPLIDTCQRIKRIHYLKSIRHVLFGGESIQLENLLSWIDSPYFHAQISNMYGPTECTDITCAYTLHNPKDYIGKAIPIGCAIDGVVTYILDEEQQLVPIGTPGELYIGGASVGLGYFIPKKAGTQSDNQYSNQNDAQDNINQSSFIKNPFGDGLLYRTRDLVRSSKFNHSLQLEFLARSDDQVKIRGFRVELGEIASQMMLLDYIKEAVVISSKEENLPQRLIAYFITTSKKTIDLHTIRDHLKINLPDYMIPNAYVEIDKWPLSPNGKIDKKALPKAEEKHSLQSIYVAPRTLIESQLVNLWQQYLKIKTIGIHDNFFELGGHSLIATQLIGNIAREFGIEIPLKVFFEQPSIAELAQRLEQGESFDHLSHQDHINIADRSQLIPLSFAQERLWIIEQINPGSSAYNIPIAIELNGELNTIAFKKAMYAIVDRHEALRTLIKTSSNGIAYQFITDSSNFILTEINLSNHSNAVTEAHNLFNHEASTPFTFNNTDNALLFRAQLIKINNSKHLFIACMHHIISDGWSLTVLQKELAAFYQAYAADKTPIIDPPPHQYADYAVWQRQYLNNDHVQQHLEYWIDHLQDAPPFLHLPTDRPRPEQQTFNGAVYTSNISENLHIQLDTFSKTLGTTYFTILLSAFALLLSKYTHQDDICVGTPVSGREKFSLQNLIGYFVNAVVIRNKLNGNPNFKQILERTQDAALGAFAHQDVPIEQVLDKLPIARNLSYPPIAQVGFSYISQELSELISIDDLTINIIDLEKKIAKYDLTLIVATQNNKLQLHFEYNTDLFDTESIKQLAEHFQELLENCITQPDIGINNINLLTDDELFTATSTSKEYVEAILPLTPMQQDMVMAQWLQPDSLANTLGYRAELNFEVDANLWQQAVNLMASRQAVTRTQFKANSLKYGEFAYQCIYKKIDITLDVMDYRKHKLTVDDINKQVDAFIYQPEKYTENQFIRYGLMRLANNRTILLLSSHHALLDGIAIVHIAETTAKYYEALHYKHDLNSTPTLPLTFANYIIENRKLIDTAEVQHFWKQKLLNCEAPDFSLPLTVAHKTSQIVKTHELPTNLWKSLKIYCRKNGMTTAQLFKLLYSLLIANYCRTDADFYLSEFHAGRNKDNAFSLGCFFVQSPFIFSCDLLKTETPISALFSYLKSYRKEIKPFDQISLGLTRKLAAQGRLHFMYNYYHFFPQEQEMLGHPITCIETPPFIENTVQLVIKEHADNAQLDIYYQNNCFDDKQFLQRLEILCTQLIEGKQTIGELSYLLPQEHKQQLYNWNNIDIQEHACQSVQNLFESQVDKTPDSIAIVDDNSSISYRRLNERANQLAHYLHQHGVGSDVRVALCMPRNIEAIIIILGIIKAGGAYVPIDTNYPEERIYHMLDCANIDILFTQHKYTTRFTNFKGLLICLDDTEAEFSSIIKQQSIINPINTTQAQDMLYVIFTSGSTGKPKGATVTHKGEINLLQWYVSEFDFNPHTCCLIISALGFDLTQKNLFAPLISGGQLILSQLEYYDSGAIHQLISTNNVTLINCAPSAFYPLVEDHTAYETLQSLRTLIFGGETIKVERLAPWFDSHFCHIKLINNYGPTECTDISSFFRIENPQDYYHQPIPIGKPNDNVQVYILNPILQLLPTGLIGEICVAGSGVGRGYLHNDDLNQQKFIPNPFGSGRLYRTGDLGRYLSDGNIEFIMRQDFQVKINGLRIELGEIEHVIRQQEGVFDTIVMVHNNQLIAYIVSQHTPINSSEWPTVLSRSLPAYMIPSYFSLLEKWPLTPNGKIDRDALPAPENQQSTVDYVAPRDDIEQVICTIVENILALDQVGIYDNFFDLGGHSLAASRAIVQIREHFKIDIPLNVLFEMTTVEKLAAYIKASQWALQSANDHREEDDNRDTGSI